MKLTCSDPHGVKHFRDYAGEQMEVTDSLIELLVALFNSLVTLIGDCCREFAFVEDCFSLSLSIAILDYSIL